MDELTPWHSSYFAQCCKNGKACWIEHSPALHPLGDLLLHLFRHLSRLAVITATINILNSEYRMSIS